MKVSRLFQMLGEATAASDYWHSQYLSAVKEIAFMQTQIDDWMRRSNEQEEELTMLRNKLERLK